MSQPMPLSMGLTTAHNAIPMIAPMMIATVLTVFVIMRYR